MARLEQLLEQIRKDRDVRRNLIDIRQNISDESLRRQFISGMAGDYSLLISLLAHEDPKVRKNAALILGMTGEESLLPVLFEAWEKEDTLFVREDYLKAISGMDYSAYLPKLEARIGELTEKMNLRDGSGEGRPVEDSSAEDGSAGDGSGEDESADNPLWDNDRHLLAELSRLRRMTERYEEHGRHHFTRMKPAPELLLRTNLLHVDVTAEQVTCGSVHAMRGGVHVKSGDLYEILKIRTWTECLFPIPGARPIQGDEKMIASKLRDLKIANYLNYLHEENGRPYRYRIELKSESVPREKRGAYIRRIASRLDVLEKGKLLNSDSDYEVELRLIGRRDHSLIPMLKLFTLPDHRFAYRKEATAQSTSAHLAALAAALARPFLKEDAQILDPFCGAGTLLIERCIACHADPVYGVDRFAEAIDKARVNASLASGTGNGITGSRRIAPIHFINRDFFDFTHDYPFDEVITYLPDVPDGEEKDFAGRFLKKASTLLKEQAVLVILTNAPDALREAAAEEKGVTLVEEHLLNERTGCSELILRKH